MRVGPLGAFYYADMDKLLVNTIESCLLTTRDPRFAFFSFLRLTRAR
jgi:hypothetical protein